VPGIVAMHFITGNFDAGEFTPHHGHVIIAPCLAIRTAPFGRHLKDVLVGMVNSLQHSVSRQVSNLRRPGLSLADVMLRGASIGNLAAAPDELPQVNGAALRLHRSTDDADGIAAAPNTDHTDEVLASLAQSRVTAWRHPRRTRQTAT
jgi:hypothetical protein